MMSGNQRFELVRGPVSDFRELWVRVWLRLCHGFEHESPVKLLIADLVSDMATSALAVEQNCSSQFW